MDYTQERLEAVTRALERESQELAIIAHDFLQERRNWTHPAGRAELARAAMDVTDWAQLAALESNRGDYWSKLDALQAAEARRDVALKSLLEWWRRGELWNGHRLRPVPGSVATALEAM